MADTLSILSSYIFFPKICFIVKMLYELAQHFSPLWNVLCPSQTCVGTLKPSDMILGSRMFGGVIGFGGDDG